MPRQGSSTGSPFRGKRRIVTWPPEGYTPNKGIDESNELFDLDDDAWRSAFDVEPLPDGIRRRNGLIFSSDTQGTVLTENTTGSEDFQPLNTASGKITQGISPAIAGIIESIEFFFRITSQPAIPVSISLSIQTDNAGEPSGTSVAGFTAGAFSTILTSQMTTSFAEFAFNMVTPTSLAAGTYWLVLRSSLPTAINLYAKADMDGDPYNGAVLDKAGRRTASVWGFQDDDDDLVFSINQTPTEVEITGIHDFKDGFGNTRHIVAFTKTIYKNVSGVLTSLGTFDTDHGSDVHPSLISCDGRLLATNGVSGDPSKKFYLDGGTPRFANEGISKPTTQLVAAPVLSGGTLSDGVYSVDYYYVDKTAPREVISNPRDEGDSDVADTADTAGASDLGSISITGMATAVARTNDRATHKRIMILGPGTANKWVYSGIEVAIATTTATISDPLLFGAEAEFDHDVAPTHSIKAAGAERQFIAGIESNPRRVQWSRARGTLVSVESYPPFNRKDLGVGDDETTALALVPPNTVLVGMRNSIWALDETQPSRPPELISNRVGIAGHKSLTVVGRQAYFWSDSENHKGPFKFDGRNVVPLVALDKTVNGEGGTPNLNLSRIPLISCAHYAAGDTRFQWWSAVSQAGETAHDLILVYDYNIESWTKYRVASNILGEVEVSNQNAVFIGTVAGRELQADQGNDDIGSPIKGEVTLRPLTFGDIHDRSHIRGLVTRSQSTNLGDLLLVLTSDLDFGGESSTITVVLNQEGAAGSLLGTGTLGTFVLAGSGELLRDHSFRSVGRVFEARLSGTAPWYLNRLAWRVRESGRR